MATCKECLHYDVCLYLIDAKIYGYTDENIFEPCQKFKDKSKYVEQKRGKWKERWSEDYITYFHRCSVCGEDALTKEETAHDEVLSNYCPNCGAKMDGD